MYRSIRHTVLASALVAVALLLSALPAGAHVEIDPESAPRGSLSVLNFVVPNESDSASTTQLEIQFPAGKKITTAAVQPLPGWTANVEKSSDTVQRIVWTGGSFGPGEFQQFAIRVGLPDRGKKLEFKAIQTYSDGEVVSWIQRSVKGAPEPEHPAPVLELTAPDEGHH